MLNRMKDYGQFKNILAIFILSVIIACMGKGPVNRLTNALMPVENVTIEVVTKGNGIWIYDDENQSNLFPACRTGEKEGTWEYRDKESYGYANDMLYTDGTQELTKISFQSKVFQNSYIIFGKTEQGGKIRILTDNGANQEIDLDSNNGEEEEIRVYPFEDRILPVIMHLVLYAILFLFIFIILMAIYCLLLWKQRRNGWLSKTVKRQYFFLVWFALYVYAIIQYKIGIPNYLSTGDDLYYWNISLFETGKGWDPSLLSEELVSFRGYLCHLFPTVSKYISSYLGINALYIYFLFTSIALAGLTVIVLPELYYEFTSKKATNLQALLFMPIYLFFWNGTLTAVLIDIFGVVAFFSGILFAFQFKRNRFVRSAVFSGFFLSVACNLRTAYQYALLVAFIFLISKKVFVRFRYWKQYREIEKEKNGKIIYGFAAAIAAFIIVALPQLQINLERGHFGLLPYDFNQAWKNVSIAEYSANYAIGNSYAGFPVTVTDEQLLSLKKAQYNVQDSLSIAQILGVYSNDLLNSVTAVAKKAFVAFDIKTNVTFPDYPQDIPWNSSRGFVFSFTNYFVLWSALYVLFYQKKVSVSERIIAVIFGAGLVLPQMFVHVEWRYFLATYVLLYYLFSYHFVGEVLISKEKCQELGKTNYLLFIGVSILISFVISLSLYAATFA